MSSIIHPDTNTEFTSIKAGGRICYAISYRSKFAILVSPPDRLGVGVACEAVVSVDGRCVLTNRDASRKNGGIIITAPYRCLGFQVDQGSAAGFVHTPKGGGTTTAERNNTSHLCGLVAIAFFRSKPRRDHREPAFAVLRGMSAGGASAGEQVSNELTEVAWERGDLIYEELLEYDTRESWHARGVEIADVNMASPWPGEKPQFAVQPL